MFRYKKLIVTVVFVLCAALNMKAFENQQKQAETLSLMTFIELASKHDVTFHKLLLEKLALRYDQGVYVDSETLLTSIVTGFSLYPESIYNNSSLSLSRVLPDKGQLYSAEYTFTPDGTDSHSLSFSFSQDIAQNAFGKSVKLDRSIQHIKSEISSFQIIEAYEDYMAELTSLYYSWILHFENYQLATSSYQENQKVLDSIIKRQQKKIADQTDVDKLKLQILSKKDQLIEFKLKYIETTRMIMNIIQKPFSTALIPSTELTIDPIPLADSELQQSRSVLFFEFLKRQSLLEVERLARDLMPSIQLISTVSQTDQTESTVAISVDLPLINKKAKALHEVAKLNETIVTYESDSAKDALLLSIKNLYLALEAQEQLAKNAAEKRQLAKSILENESENYTYGKINLNDYIVAVNRHDGARFDEIRQYITYKLLTVEWNRLTDQLITNSDLNR